VPALVQIGAAVSAETGRCCIQPLEITAEVHEAAGILAVVQAKQVTDFMQRDLRGSLENLSLQKGTGFRCISQPKHGNNGTPPPLLGFAENMGEYRHEKIHVQ
jgi:hypothetical protein